MKPELTPQEIKHIFQQAAKAERTPEAQAMISAALQKKSQPQKMWIVPAIVGAAALAALFLWAPWRAQSPQPKTPLQPVAVPNVTNNQPSMGATVPPQNNPQSNPAAPQKSPIALSKDEEKKAVEQFKKCKDAHEKKELDNAMELCSLVNKDSKIYQEGLWIITSTSKEFRSMHVKRAEAELKKKTEGGYYMALQEIATLTKFFGEKDSDVAALTKSADSLSKELIASIAAKPLESYASSGKLTGLSKEEAFDKIESAAVSSDCADALAMISDYLRLYGPDPSMYWYKAYCYRVSNPEAACQAYHKFIKLAKSDGRVSQAQKYIAAQDATAYPSCAGTTSAAQDAQDALDDIRSTITGGDCASGLRMISEFAKKYGTHSADLYWYKAYCYRDSNPESACLSYLKFLKLAKGDSRANAAKQYIQSQDTAMYPVCVLP